MRGLPLLPVLALAACDRAPTYLRTSGAVGDREARLGWILLVIAAAVIVVVSALTLAGIFHRRPAADTGLMRTGAGLRWIILGGIVVPAVILVGVLIVSTRTLAAVARPPVEPAATVQVIGHRWWWEVRYDDAALQKAFTTANEIHIPVGLPVRLELSTADVIHSFWIPQLAGKMDLIPGQHNVMWIEADSAGTYWGHCAEYCGLQHANMAMVVVAESRPRFARWLAAQRLPAAAPAEREASAGQAVFERTACALCHTIRGTGAGGALGPDLTHLASRRTIAAGILPNTRGDLAGWIGNPQALKPGVAMPVVPLSPRELRRVLAYLQSLD